MWNGGQTKIPKGFVRHACRNDEELNQQKKSSRVSETLCRCVEAKECYSVGTWWNALK